MSKSDEVSDSALMRKKILITLMAFSLFTTYSRADIYFADFFSNDFGPSMSLECWNEDGTFNEDNCNRSEFECSFQGSEKNFEAKKVIFQFSEEHLNKIKRNGEYYISMNSRLEDYDYDFNESSSLTRTPESRQIYPANSKVSIFKKEDYKNEIKILFQGKINEDGTLPPLEDRPYSEEISFSVTGELDENQSYYIDLFDEDFHYYPKRGPEKIKLSEGDYPLVIRRGSSGPEYRMLLKVKPPGKQVTQREIILSVDQFRPQKDKPEKIYWKQDYKNNRELTLSWDSKVNESIYFKDLRSITLNKIKDKNLSNFFIIQKGIPKVSPIKEEDFKRFISRFPTYRMKASGICFTATPKEKIKEFPIKKSPRGDEEEIGSIIINYSRLNNSVKTLLKTGDKTKEINISFFETNCRGEGHVSTSYPIKEVNGKYVNLSRGAWGEEGWVELEYKPIEKWGASFELGELRSVGFTKNGDGKYLVTGINMERSETEINEVGDESPEVNTSFTIEEERLWRNDNEFIPYYDCSYGC